jgi:hypothetical protein
VAEPTGAEWAELGLEAGLEEHGSAYGGYHRLKVSAVTDDLSALLASLGGFDEDSDELLAITYLVRAWRNLRYAYEPAIDPVTGEATTASLNRFLLEYDLQHRLRRLAFLRRRVNALDSLNPGAVRVIAMVTPLDGDEIRAWDPETRAAFRADLRRIKKDLSAIAVQLRFLGRELRSPTRSPLREAAGALGIDRAVLHRVIEPASEAGRERRAGEVLEARREPFDALAALLAERLSDGIPVPADDPAPRVLVGDYGTRAASGALDAALAGDGIASEVLRRYRDGFDDFDMVAYPMLYGTEGAETDVVEIVRISPEDATSIVDERASRFQTRKTRGWKYWHFGAFLSPAWRRNDILYGRLDAAECLIKALVPAGNPQRETLLRQAQRAIITESFRVEDRIEMLGPDADSLDDAAFVARFAARYRVDDELPPAIALPILGRGADVTGKVLDGVAERPGAVKKLTGWVARLGSWFAGIVALGTPGSGSGMVFRHVFPILVALEILLAVLGVLFRSDALLWYAIVALVLTLVVRMLMSAVGALIDGKRWPARVLRASVRVVVLLLFLAGLVIVFVGVRHGWEDVKSFVEQAF